MLYVFFAFSCSVCQDSAHVPWQSWCRTGLCPAIIQLLNLVVVPEPDTAVTNGSVFLLYRIRGGREAQKTPSVNTSYKYKSIYFHWSKGNLDTSWAELSLWL